MVTSSPGLNPKPHLPNDATIPVPPTTGPRRPLDLSGLNPAQYEAVTLPPGPVLVIAGRGLGQDPRAHAPARVPRRRARRVAVRDPRDHVHQQGRGRDAGAGRRARRPGRPPHVGVDLPRRVLADPAARGDAARLPVELHDLRPGRRGAPHRLGAPRPQPRPEAVPGAAAARQISALEERAGAARGVRGDGGRARRSAGSPRCTPSTSAGLQEASAVDFDDLLVLAVRLFREHPEALAALPAPVPARPRRRVPGHERRAVGARAPARRKTTAASWSSATTISASSPARQITMGDGSRKPIEEVAVGDEVLSSYGSGDFGPARVADAYRPGLRRVCRSCSRVAARS